MLEGEPGAEPGPPAGRPATDRGGQPVAPPAGSLGALGVLVGTVARTAAARARRHPLEAVAIVLLGLGGLIFPPVWLMGAALALASKVWDIRDKWVGVALPVFLVVAGMAADISLSASQPTLLAYLKEAWLFGDHICRIVALLGAVYLGWRTEHGRRPPPVPPWNRPRRLG